MRVAEAIRMGYPAPEMRWQDDEAIHQDVLQRQILLQDDLDPGVIAAAQERWMALANQAAQKQGGGGMPGMPQAPAGPQGPTAPSGGPPAASVPALPANQLPLASGNPPIGITNLVQAAQAGTDEAEQAAQQADALSQQF